MKHIIFLQKYSDGSIQDCLGSDSLYNPDNRLSLTNIMIQGVKRLNDLKIFHSNIIGFDIRQGKFNRLSNDTLNIKRVLL